MDHPRTTLAKIGHTYRHFKGGVYVVQGFALDSDHQTPLVVYKEANGDKVWARPQTEFEGLNDQGQPRFEHIGAPTRLTWDAYFIEVAHLISQRATCDRKHVGAVFVNYEHRILATGYNGSPPRQDHCDDAGHDIVVTDGRENCVRTVHAEQNGIYQAARFGIALLSATLYVNTFPCWNCAKAILSAGVLRVVFDADYNNDPRVSKAFEKGGVHLEKFVQ